MQFLMSKQNKKDKINIYYCNRNNNYIVYNTEKEWKDENGNYGHTHVKKYDTALYLADCIIHKKIPKKVNKYFLVSLKRLSNDKIYTEKIQKRIDNEPKKNYRNVPKNFLKR